ncbi:hypothetical protein JCM9279_001348 [Rhodotorula babjevae]
MALWAAEPPQPPYHDAQYSLPPPPNLLPAPHGPSTTTSSALPPPPPPTSLDAARLRLTLERVKLELDGARGAIGEVLALRGAVDSLREEVRLAREDRQAQNAVVEQHVLAAVPALLDQLLAPLRESVTAIADSLAAGQRLAEERLSALEARVEREVAVLRSRTERVEQQVRGDDSGTAPSLGAASSAQVRELEQKMEEMARAGEAQRDAIEKLSEQVVRVEARLEERDVQPRARAPPAEPVRLTSPAVPSAEPPSPTPAAAAPPPPRPAARAAPFAAAATSSSSTAPSPPTLHPRRFLPSLRDPSPVPQPQPHPHLHQPTSLPALPVPAAPASLDHTSPTARAATVPAAPPGPISPGLARQGTKRRVIEQDESLSESEGEAEWEGGGAAASEEEEEGEGEGEGGRGRGGKRRRRVIEQDVTPGGTQEGGLEVEREQVQVQVGGTGRVDGGGGGEEEEADEAEPDTQ